MSEFIPTCDREEYEAKHWEGIAEFEASCPVDRTNAEALDGRVDTILYAYSMRTMEPVLAVGALAGVARDLLQIIRGQTEAELHAAVEDTLDDAGK